MAGNMDRHYLDQAATSWPKSPAVLQAFQDYFVHCGASPGRGAYRSSLDADAIVSRARQQVALLIGADRPSDIFFASNGTQALNLAIQGIALGQVHRAAEGAPIHVVTTATEHNSVLRALSLAKEHGWLDFTIVPCSSDGGLLPERIEAAIQDNTQWIVLNHASNVTGAVQPLSAISAIVRKHRLRWMLDAAQSLGYLPIDVHEAGIDILAAPSHKGIGGLVGASVLFVNSEIQQELHPLWAGGTGQASHKIDGPWQWSEQVEAGNMNVAAIAALETAIQIHQRQAPDDLHKLAEWSKQLLDAIADLENLELVGPSTPELDQRLPVFSLKLSERAPMFGTGATNCQEWAMILEQMASIECRAGFHCAGAIHSCLGTDDQGGTLRLSLGLASTQENVDAACSALPMLDGFLHS